MDVVISVGGRPMTSYDEIMDSIPFAQRPMRIEFTRTILGSSLSDHTTIELEAEKMNFNQCEECEEPPLCTASQSECDNDMDKISSNLEHSFSIADSNLLNSFIDSVEFGCTCYIKVLFTSLPLVPIRLLYLLLYSFHFP